MKSTNPQLYQIKPYEHNPVINQYEHNPVNTTKTTQFCSSQTNKMTEEQINQQKRKKPQIFKK
jgi:hypothetical protein